MTSISNANRPIQIELMLFVLVSIVVVWVAVMFQILVVRMFCEWSLITTKAAQIYVIEKCEKG